MDRPRLKTSITLAIPTKGMESLESDHGAFRYTPSRYMPCFSSSASS